MKIKKALCVLLSCGIAAGSLIGCRGREGDQGGDSAANATKSQFSVSLYNGGVGREWLDKTIKAFEEKYADKEFESGKKGVHVNVEANKTNTAGSTLLAGIKNNPNDVFFTESVYYYDLLGEGAVADISDIVTGNMTEFGEEKSIESKMKSSLQSFFKYNDKYYALPFYEGYIGFIYSVDLFEKENLFFKDGYETQTSLAGKFIRKSTDKKSKGPDGKYDTYDDGLPATYADFYDLCQQMTNNGITPIVWPGSYKYVSSYAAYQMWADYEGEEQFYLNFSFDGVAKDLVESIDDNGNVKLMPETQINNKNGVLLQKQRGKYEVLKFWEEIMKDRAKNYYHDNCIASATQTMAQATFLNSLADSAVDKVGMLVDGNWWEREAEDTGSFKALEKRITIKREDLRFGFMSFPKASADKVDGSRTIVSVNDSIAFVSSRSKGVQLELAKLFLQFCHTDEMLSLFSTTTNMMKPFNYTLSEKDQNKLTFFGKQMYAIKDPQNGVSVVYPYSDNKVFLNNFSSFHPQQWGFVVNNQTAVSENFTTKKETAKSYFEKLYTSYLPKWNNFKNVND